MFRKSKKVPNLFKMSMPERMEHLLKERIPLDLIKHDVTPTDELVKEITGTCMAIVAVNMLLGLGESLSKNCKK